MFSGPLKVSIITVCLNAENTIEAAIQSVLSQTYRHIEYIIIDGQSKDATMARIEKYKDKIFQLISERDRGVYDAMNKGIQRSSGDIIYFLNADDSLCSNKVIETVVEDFNSDASVEIVYGKVILTTIPQKKDFNLRAFYSEIKSPRMLFRNALCHQRIFVRKMLFGKLGLFDANYQILGDFDWLLKAYKNQIPMKFVDMDIAYYNPMGKSFIERKRSLKERIRIGLKNLSLFELLWFFDRFFRKDN